MLEIIILSLIFIISLILVFRNFDQAIKVLLVLSVFLHKEVFSIYRWDFLPVRFFMLAIGVYGGVQLLRWFLKVKDVKKVLNILKDPFVSVLILIWLVRGISIFFSKNLSASIMLYGFFSTVVALGLLMYQQYRGKPDQVLQLIKNYILIAFFIVLFGYFQMYLYSAHDIIIGALWNIPGRVARIGSTFWDVNHFAALLASLLPILGVLILTEGPMKKKIFRSTAFLIMTAMLLLTSSRTSWIIAFVSFLIFLLLLLIKNFGKKGVLFLIGVVLLASTLFAIEYSDRSSPMRAYVKDNFHYRLDSFDSHIMLLVGSYQVFEEYPILGGGYGGFFEHFKKAKIAPEFFGRDPAALNTRVPAHTIWGEEIAGTGVVGLALFIIFVVLLSFTMLYGFFKAKNNKSKLLSGAMFSTFIGILTAGIFYSYNSEFFWLILFLYFIYSVSIIPSKVSYREIFTHFLKSEKLYLTIIVIMAGLYIFVNLGKNHLVPWDEAIYAKIAKNMVERSEYINMYWQKNTIWYEKPPFYMWAMAGFMNILGATSLAAKLPSALFGFATVILVFFMSKKFFGKFAAYISSLALLFGVHFLYYSRAAMTDVTTTFFITLAMFLFSKTKEKNNKNLWFLIGLSVGFAIMTKGAIGILPLVILGLVEILSTRSIKELFNKSNIMNYSILILGVFIIAAPWHLVMYQRYGFGFINKYFLYHVVSRATSAIEDKGQPFFWYFTVMKVSMRIWFIPLLVAAPYFFIRSIKKEMKYLLFSVWFLTIFLVLSAASSKITWYIIPIYPVAAIMVAGFMEESYKWFVKKIIIEDLEILRAGVLFIITVFSSMYFFFYRGLIYTSDLTGDIAELLMLKDERFGTEEIVYVDRVPDPIIMYYTDGPYKVIDFAPDKGRFPTRFYTDSIIIISKAGRFASSDTAYGQESKIISEVGDYILFYYESDLNIDTKLLQDLQKELESLQINPYLHSVRISEIENQIIEIEARLAPYVSLEVQ